MACLLCGSRETSRRIVDLDDESIQGEVCTECATEYLLMDPGSPTCEFCTELADYSLAEVRESDEVTRPFDVDTDMEVIEKDVLCEEHFDDLRADAPANVS